MKTKFEFEEHYFTSSKFKGGFRTLDNSEDLLREEVGELEKKGLYNPPIELPSSPTNEEIYNLFPTNCSFFKLKSSGKYVFLHSNYTGRTNHTIDRFGNFFSHSIVLSDNEFLLPAKLIFEKVNFRTSLSIEEDLDYSPNLKKNLEIEIDDLTLALENLFIGFQVFFNSKIHLIKLFSKVFDLILEGKISKPGYNITICDEKGNLRDLIFSVNYFLPRILANKISFATYVDNPDSPNYPFEITGIVPECGIDRLPVQYFTLVDARKISDYTAIQPYTKLLVEIIKESNYLKWQKLLKEIQEFEVNDLDNLNVPASFLDFTLNIRNGKSHTDFRNLLTKVGDKKMSELKEFVLNENVELYRDYLFFEIEKITSQSYVLLTVKFNSFLTLFREHFDKISTFTNDLIFQTLEAFRDKFSGFEKSKSSLFLLTNFDFITLKLTNIQDVLVSADSYFEDNTLTFDEKLKAIQGLEPYNSDYLDTDQNKNIMKYKKLDELLKHASNGKLSVDTWLNYKADLVALKEDERLMLITLCFNSTFSKTKFNFDFTFHILIIESIIPDNQSAFWKTFFERNEYYNKEKSLIFYSIAYLKKKFVSYLFLSAIKKLNLLSSFGFDEEAVKWIQDDISERALDTECVDKFKHMFRNFLSPKKSWYQ